MTPPQKNNDLPRLGFLGLGWIGQHRMQSLREEQACQVVAIADPSPENVKKYEYAVAHFQRLNKWLEKERLPTRYQFNFLSPKNYNAFFQKLRDDDLKDFRSDLDVALRSATS